MPEDQYWKSSTSSRSGRKLAAILFADIIGYTALMQRDEASARRSLQKFRDELTDKVAAFNGQIINFYGDGCLCIFDSSVDATSCATAVQKIFQSMEPKLPVRIGLHSGDVFFEADNVFGDSVNLASRIESMGIAGAVLISERVYRDIKNQTIFQPVDLGAFDFKNVELPMKVYALQGPGLAIPEAGALQGKLKKAAPTSKIKTYVWLVPLLLILGALGFWYSRQGQAMAQNNAPTITTTVLQDRIAVLPIQNNTNDPELDVLGKMASDWITRGLMEIENAQVVSPYTVRQNLDAVGILPNDPSGKTSFSDLTGARNFIDGNFYKEGEELIFHLEVVDAIGGNMQFSFPEIRGKTNEKEALITQLREKICGYWAAKELVDLKKIKTPDYQAYQMFLKSIQSFQDSDVLNEILALDSSFYLARIHFLNMNRAGFNGDGKPHFTFLERHWDNLSNYEKAWYDFLKAMYLGDAFDAFESINALRIKYPKDFAVNHETAVMALEGLNNPQLALDIYKELDAEPYKDKRMGLIYNLRAFHMMGIAHKLRDSTLMKYHYQSMAADETALQIPFLLGKLFGASILKDQEAFDGHLNDLLTEDKDQDVMKVWFLLVSFESKIFNASQRRSIRNTIVEFVKQSKHKTTLETIYKNCLEVLERKTPNVDLEALATLPTTIQIMNLVYAAPALANAGKTTELVPIMKRLESLSQANLHLSTQFGAGYSNYVLGRIYAEMKRYGPALEYFRKARDLGFATYVMAFDYDIALAPMHNMPGFRVLNEAKWPKVLE